MCISNNISLSLSLYIYIYIYIIHKSRKMAIVNGLMFQRRGVEAAGQVKKKSWSRRTSRNVVLEQPERSKVRRCPETPKSYMGPNATFKIYSYLFI